MKDLYNQHEDTVSFFQGFEYSNIYHYFHATYKERSLVLNDIAVVYKIYSVKAVNKTLPT